MIFLENFDNFEILQNIGPMRIIVAEASIDVKLNLISLTPFDYYYIL